MIEQRGDKIKGSRLFRDFCNCCGQPMRVQFRVDFSKKVPYCTDCTPSEEFAHTHRTPGQKAKIGRTMA
jgi:hypothetical protein